nr:SMI1/KNR4 family protein [Telluria cellulosilytica]
MVSQTMCRAGRSEGYGAQQIVSTPLTATGVEELIAVHQSIINFGLSSDAVEDEWLANAENALNRKLPESYKWFLKRYAGGEVGGEEIYSIYGIPFESANGGDIVFHHLMNRKAGLLDDSKLVISETDLGEVFFFDYMNFKDGECSIYLRLPSGEHILYAENFYEFLGKRIVAHDS